MQFTEIKDDTKINFGTSEEDGMIEIIATVNRKSAKSRIVVSTLKALETFHARSVVGDTLITMTEEAIKEASLT